MTFGKIGFAAIAFAALVGFGGHAAQAAPFSAGATLSDKGLVTQAQYRDHRRMAPPRRVCRWETVERRVRGRIIRERVQKCRMVRR